LPVEFQFAPVFSMAAMDVNKDGNPDIISGGNLSATRSRTGKLTGNPGFVFLGDGHGNFSFLPPAQTGINCKGDVRQMLIIKDRIIIGVNNSPVLVYQLK
jgi:hypothetical protein